MGGILGFLLRDQDIFTFKSPEIIPHRGPSPLKPLTVTNPPAIERLPRLSQSHSPAILSSANIVTKLPQIHFAPGDAIS